MEAEAHRHEDKLRTMNSSSTGFCYSDISTSTLPTHLMNQIHTIESNPDQMFNLTTNMEMIGYFPPANDDQSSMVVAQDHSNSWQENHRLLVDDSSLRCVFSGEGNNQRTSQGLSLSLSSINPSAGFESFDLRHTSSTTPTANHQMRYVSSTSKEGYYGKPSHSIPPEQQMMPDGFLGKVSNLHIHQHGLHQFHLIRHSKYLTPAQELLNEFCSLGSKQSEHHHYHQQKKSSKQKVNRVNQWDHNDHAGTCSNEDSSRPHNLNSLELLELQKRKAQLLSMLEEVDRRYKHYCDQMKAVVSSFEAAAGNGAATVYSALASKAMSRHFRCLRDGIVDQIRATKKAMGEKDDQVALGTTRGETPRLRLLDQTLRQQKAFQQLNMMECHPWRPQRGLPERSVSVLRAWLFEHFLHPYPTDVDKHILARQTGLSRSQVSNWFINARVRLWKPMVEEMYMEEAKEELENPNTSHNLASNSDDNSMPATGNTHFEDEKPTSDQLIRIDSDCLSSIINHKTEPPPHTGPTMHHGGSASLQLQHPFYSGPIELDFSSYSHGQNLSLAGGVSLTLGLQQHGEAGGVSLAFPSSAAGGSSMFYGGGRESIDDCQTMQYASMMDGDQGQNLPYRNLMGAQLLHDMAG
uniref:Homeobox domain-containing protein n=1 Tax=Kalanchoe fedtschenkoi TaxID=63787 RepID=A0A7N0VGE7_KALFE